MINHLPIVFSFLLSIGAVNSYAQDHSQKDAFPPKECIELNNEGEKYFENYPMNGEGSLNRAIELLKQAIACDSNYTLAYMNLANAYGPSHKNNNSEQILIYNKVLILTHNDPNILFFKGMSYERMNNLDSANFYYSLAKLKFEKMLAKKPGNINLIDGLIHVKAIMFNRDSALQELDKQIKLHPEIASKITYERYFYEHFNRHDIIYETSSVDSTNK